MNMDYPCKQMVEGAHMFRARLNVLHNTDIKSQKPRGENVKS